MKRLYLQSHFDSIYLALVVSPTARAVDPFGQPFRPTGVQLPGQDLDFLASGLSGFVKYAGLALEGLPIRMSIIFCYSKLTNSHNGELRHAKMHLPLWPETFSQTWRWHLLPSALPQVSTADLQKLFDRKRR